MTVARQARSFAVMMMPFLLAAMIQPAAIPPGWNIYRNARFGYSICYPRSFAGQPEADNGDGRMFSGRNAELRVWGSNNALGRTTAQAARADRQLYTRNGGRITYERLGRGWYVLTGRKGGRIFYQKTLARSGQFTTFTLTYDTASGRQWSPVVSRIEKCFRSTR